MPPKRGRAPPDDGVSDLLFGFDDGADADDGGASDGDASGDSRGAAPLHPPRARRRAAPSSQPAPTALNIDAILDAGDDAATVSSTSTRSDSWDEPAAKSGREAAVAVAAPARAAGARATALEQALAAADRAAAAASASPSSSSSPSEDGDEGGGGAGAAAAPVALSDDGASPTTVALAFRTRRGGQLTVSLAVDAPLARAFAAFEAKARAQGWIQEDAPPPRYVFDGQALDGGATPGGLDMEDGDVVDVWE